MYKPSKILVSGISAVIIGTGISAAYAASQNGTQRAMYDVIPSPEPTEVTLQVTPSPEEPQKQSEGANFSPPSPTPVPSPAPKTAARTSTPKPTAMPTAAEPASQPAPSPTPVQETPTSYGCYLPDGPSTMKGLNIVRDVKKGDVIGKTGNRAIIVNTDGGPKTTVSVFLSGGDPNSLGTPEGMEYWDMSVPGQQPVSYLAVKGKEVRSLTDGTVVFTGEQNNIPGRSYTVMVIDSQCRVVTYLNVEYQG